MRIGVFSPGMAIQKDGGTMTFTLNLCQAMNERGHEMYVYAFQKDVKLTPRILPQWMRLRLCSPLGSQQSISALREQLCIDDLDVAVSIESYYNSLLWVVALLGTGIPLIYSERSDPERVETIWCRAGRLSALSGADVIHLLLPEYAASLPPFLRDRMHCIPNPAPAVADNATAFRKTTPPYVLCSLGRIAKEKELPLLIKAFSRIAKTFPDWELHIWGENSNAVNLLKYYSGSPARKRIFLRGRTDAPLDVFRQAHIFCIPSRHEGTPNALLEAFSCGLPAVGVADCLGVNSIINNGKNGLLASVRTPAALSEELAKLMTSRNLRQQLGEGAICTAKDRAPKAIWDMWEKLLVKTAAHKGKTIMDAFSDKAFAARARLSAAARQENILRKFGEPLSGSVDWYRKKISSSLRQVAKTMFPGSVS